MSTLKKILIFCCGFFLCVEKFMCMRLWNLNIMLEFFLTIPHSSLLSSKWDFSYRFVSSERDPLTFAWHQKNWTFSLLSRILFVYLVESRQIHTICRFFVNFFVHIHTKCCDNVDASVHITRLLLKLTPNDKLHFLNYVRDFEIHF
jgi:hypothetical protein